MNFQTILIYLLVAGAAWYVGKKIYKSITEKNCAQGGSCNCSKVDAKKTKWKK